MLRTVFLITFALAVAIGGGAASAWYMIDRGIAFGAVSVGPWTAFPERGTPAADPYSKARFARTGDLSLGQAEGIVFNARRDSAGESLRPDCDYSVEGPVPPARFWTLHIRDHPEDGVPRPIGRNSALHSLSILRGEDGSFSVTISANPAPGNWLRSSGGQDMALALTLYDTAVAATARAGEVELPQIRRIACD